jgi:hypothetical protein
LLILGRAFAAVAAKVVWKIMILTVEPGEGAGIADEEAVDGGFEGRL